MVPQGGRIEVTDLGSSNGLFVNERRVQTAVVGQTDAVRLGSLPIDLFRLVAAHAPARPHAVPLAQPMPAPAQGGPYPSAPTPVAVSQSSPISATPSGMEAAASPSATPAPAASRPANSGLWTLAAVVVLALVGAGIAFATQETITKKCENCSQQVVSRRAFFWQRADVEREAAAVHWCAKCADEPVPFQKTLKCKLCGAPYSQQAMTAPRREQPKDVEQRDGFCSERCRNEQLVRDGAKGAGDIFGGVLRQLTR